MRGRLQSPGRSGLPPGSLGWRLTRVEAEAEAEAEAAVVGAEEPWEGVPARAEGRLHLNRLRRIPQPPERALPR